MTVFVVVLFGSGGRFCGLEVYDSLVDAEICQAELIEGDDNNYPIIYEREVII
jgi:hypothetical protein